MKNNAKIRKEKARTKREQEVRRKKDKSAGRKNEVVKREK